MARQVGEVLRPGPLGPLNREGVLQREGVPQIGDAPLQSRLGMPARHSALRHEYHSGSDRNSGKLARMQSCLYISHAFFTHTQSGVVARSVDFFFGRARRRSCFDSILDWR